MVILRGFPCFHSLKMPGNFSSAFLLLLSLQFVYLQFNVSHSFKPIDFNAMVAQKKKAVFRAEDCYTKSAFHKKFNISRVTIDKKIEAGELPIVEVNGGILIYKER